MEYADVLLMFRQRKVAASLELRWQGPLARVCASCRLSNKRERWTKTEGQELRSLTILLPTWSTFNQSLTVFNNRKPARKQLLKFPDSGAQTSLYKSHSAHLPPQMTWQMQDTHKDPLRRAPGSHPFPLFPLLNLQEPLFGWHKTQIIG